MLYSGYSSYSGAMEPRVAYAQADNARAPAAHGVVDDATWSPHSMLAAAGAEREFSSTVMPDAFAARLCPARDEVLARVALRVARAEIGIDAESVAQAIRRLGAPYVWPHAWSLSAPALDVPATQARLARWLASFAEPGQRRCGFAVIKTEQGIRAAAVAVDAQADLSPLPRRVRLNCWLDFSAVALVPASAAKLVVAAPDGAAFHVPTSFDRMRARARVHADRAGAWRLSLVLDGPTGPRPVLEADVLAGDAAFEAAAVAGDDGPDQPPPGQTPRDDVDPARSLLQMLGAARERISVTPLAHDPTLDRLAGEHAARMMRAARLGHDVGDGDPHERLDRTALRAREVGENVAHAADAVSAHRALWLSPSHRENILDARFDHVGIGVRRDADGSLWVTEIFARLR